jgi:hypothetical protein
MRFFLLTSFCACDIFLTIVWAATNYLHTSVDLAAFPLLSV